MTQFLNEPEQICMRDEAVEAWHTSLELNPSQPKLRALVEKYRLHADPPVLDLDH